MTTPSSAGHRGGARFWTAALVVVLLIAGVGLTLYFGMRFMNSFQMLRGVGRHHGETDTSLIREWMTIPYIARAYRVPESVLWQGLGIPELGNRHKSLRMLDREFAGDQPGVIINQVRGIIQEYQARRPGTPTPPSPPNP